MVAAVELLEVDEESTRIPEAAEVAIEEIPVNVLTAEVLRVSQVHRVVLDVKADFVGDPEEHFVHLWQAMATRSRCVLVVEPLATRASAGIVLA